MSEQFPDTLSVVRDWYDAPIYQGFEHESIHHKEMMEEAPELPWCEYVKADHLATLRAACIDAIVAFEYISDYDQPINAKGNLIAALKSTGMTDDELRAELERKRGD